MLRDTNISKEKGLMLRVDRVSKRYNGVEALRYVSFVAQEGQIVSIIGPNGAGKTTLFNIITGLTQPSAGTVWLDNQRLDKLEPHKIAQYGIIRTFQQVRIFDNLTVLDNTLVGCHRWLRSNWLTSGLRFHSTQMEEINARQFACICLERVGLLDFAHRSPSELSFGNQRLLEIARALAAKPRFLLLDEPAAGLNDIEIERLTEILRILRYEGKTVILIEHRLEFVMALSDWVIVLDSGEKIAEGCPETIAKHDKVLSVYIGR
jgi:branched-chain amino acid transport system ATP-binding protein